MSGQAASTLQLDTDIISERLKEYLGFVITENTTRPADNLDVLKNEATVRGQFVREALTLMKQEGDKNLYLEAMNYGLQAFKQEEIIIR